MAKSIRSKSKRKNRTEFRNTIGTDAAKANMAIVQSKLQECINSGQMNSFDRLSNLFSGNSTTASNSNNDNDGMEDDDDGDEAMANTALTKSKDSSKIPIKSKSSTIKSKLVGQYGDKTSRKVKEATYRRGRTSSKYGGDSVKRGRGKSIEGRKMRSSSKKRSGGGGGKNAMRT